MAEPVARPWGTYLVLHEEPSYKVKRLEVLPGQRLSLQFHHQRTEDWVVVEGVGRADVAGKAISLKAGTQVHVPREAPHRLACYATSSKPLIVIETQLGTYLGEDDIVRLADDYGRAPEKGATSA